MFYSEVYKTPVNEDIAWRVTRIRLAEKFGWTLEYIDQLHEQDPLSLADVYGVIDGDMKLEQRRRGMRKK